MSNELLQTINPTFLDEALYELKEFAGFTIPMRKSDGWLYATAMCRVNKKKVLKDFQRSKSAKEVAVALCDFLQIDHTGKIETHAGKTQSDAMSFLLKTVNGGIDRGSWIHPRFAIELAGWISPQFRVQVNEWVWRYMQGDITLVRDVVERYDEVHDTKSAVVISTASREIMTTSDLSFRSEMTDFMNRLVSMNEELRSDVRQQAAEIKSQGEKLDKLIDKISKDCIVRAQNESLAQIYAIVKINERLLCSIRCQNRQFEQRVRKLEAKYPNAVLTIKFDNQPNPIQLQNAIKEEMLKKGLAKFRYNTIELLASEEEFLATVRQIATSAVDNSLALVKRVRVAE